MNFREISVIVFYSEGVVVAMGLEHSIVAQGDSAAEAIDEWIETLEAQILLDKQAGREPLEDIGPASTKYFDMFNCASIIKKPVCFSDSFDGSREIYSDIRVA